MNRLSLFRSLAILFTSGGLFFFESQSIQATIINVPAEQPTIQVGIDAASSGDTVMVASGVYMGSGNVDLSFRGKPLLVISQDGSGSTIIDCQATSSDRHRGFLFESGEGPSSVLDGFSIINGYGRNDYESGLSAGGAVFCKNNSNPTIRNCNFSNCVADVYGGALCAHFSEPTVEHCVFQNNQSLYGGGGVFTVGFFFTPMFDSCVFRANVADFGAAFWSWDSSPIILSSVFHRNWGLEGSAIRTAQAYIVIRNCTFALNRSNPDRGVIEILNKDSAVIENCVVSFSTSGMGVLTQRVAPDVLCTDIFGNSHGNWVPAIETQLGQSGNIAADPLFCDTLGGSFLLHSSSPCAEENSVCGMIGARGVGCCCVVPGDANDNGFTNIADAIFILNMIFNQGPTPNCQDEANANGSIETNIADAIYLINAVFGEGPAPICGTTGM